MCNYCEKMGALMSDFPTGHGIESDRNRSVFAHIMRDPNTNKYYFEIDEDYSAYFEVYFCPMCGRKLRD